MLTPHPRSTRDYIPGLYARPAGTDRWSIKGIANAADRYTLQSPTRLRLDIDDTDYYLAAQTELDLSASASWDTTAPTNYTVAANRAGHDFYLYACQPASGATPVFLVSANSTFPSGYTADNSRKIGTFHCVCVDVGTVAGHDLSDFVVGDLIPNSIQDLKHCPKIGLTPGMVKSNARSVWYSIYLASDDGDSGAESVYNASYLDTIVWYDCVDRGNKVGMRLLSYDEFMDMAAGTPEEEDMAAEQHTTGGHTIPDGSQKRVVSDIGAEDCAGVLNQWGLDQGYRYQGGGHTHTENTAASYTQNAETASTDPAPAWGWYNLPDSKGSIYRQGTYGVTKILYGGNWDNGSHCGSQCADLGHFPWNTYNYLGFRLACDAREAL